MKNAVKVTPWRVKTTVVLPLRIKTMPVTACGERLVYDPWLWMRRTWEPQPKCSEQEFKELAALPDGSGHGVPTQAFTSALRRVCELRRPDLKHAHLLLWVVPCQERDGLELTRIESRHGVQIRDEVVHVSRSRVLHKSRLEWLQWRAKFDLQYVEDRLSAKEVKELLAWAGQSGILNRVQELSDGRGRGTFAVKTGRVH